MSYLGEFVETPFLQHQKEGDTYLNEFKALKHFPMLRQTVTRATHTENLLVAKDASRKESLRRSGSQVLQSLSSEKFQTPFRKSNTFAEKQRAVQVEAPQFPPTERRIQESFRRSVVKDGAGQGSLSQFRGALITERLKAKQRLLAKERSGLKQSRAAREKEASLNDPDTTVRVLAKVENLARGFDVDHSFARVMLAGFTGRKVRGAAPPRFSANSFIV